MSNKNKEKQGSEAGHDETGKLPYGTTLEKITYWALFPGEWFCDLVKCKGNNERTLLRLYINLTVYAKIFGGIAWKMNYF